MSTSARTRIPEIVAKYEGDMLSEWMRTQQATSTRRADLITEQDLRDDSRRFLGLLRSSLQNGGAGQDIGASNWSEMRQMLDLTLKNSNPALILWYSYYNIFQSKNASQYWANLQQAAKG